MQIREVMTESVVTAAPARTVREIAELMRDHNVGSVVLLEGDRPVGFVTDRDLTLCVLADGCDPGTRVADFASSPVITAHPGTEVDEAGELMARHAIRRLVVFEGGKVIGIVTLDDLVARTGDRDLASQLSSRVTRAAMPGFFHEGAGG